MGAAAAPAAALAVRDGLHYGLLGLPLAFVALPLYVLLPNHYAREFGLPLATLGGVLLGARLLDACIDPWIGRWCDRLFARSLTQVLAWSGVAALVLAGGFALLFFPPIRTPAGLSASAALLLCITYAAYSVLSVAHQSWGAMLGGDAGVRSRVTGWREGLGLLGVVLAAAAPAVVGLPGLVGLFWALLVLGCWAWSRAPRPRPAAPAQAAAGAGDLWRPWRVPAFRRLMLVFVLNGIASAIPATLVLFYVQDRLQASALFGSTALALYFSCAALSLPAWLRVVARHGLGRAWAWGMLLAVLAFAGAAPLGAGDGALFLLVCAASGLALGTDLALPGALLAGVIAQAGDRGRREGAYFGWWNFAIKLNLALAAGLALPLLGWFGYAPGSQSGEALRALTLAYCVLPCALKLAACLALWRSGPWR